MSQNPYAELSIYELAHLITHLMECDYFTDAHDILSGNEENNWFNIKVNNGLFESYIQDIKLAVSISFREAKQDSLNGSGENQIGAIFKYGLILSSIISSTTDNISPEVAAILVKKKIWSLERGISFFSSQGANQTIEFLKKLINDHRFENQNLLNTIITYMPKLDNFISKLLLILEISSYTNDARFEKLKQQAVNELIEVELRDSNPISLREKILGISAVIEHIDMEARKSVIETILKNILNAEASDQVDILFELFAFTKDSDIIIELTNLYLVALSKIEDSNIKTKGYIRLLSKVNDNRKRTEVCNNAINALKSIEKDKGATISIYDLAPFLSSENILDVARLVIIIKKFPNQKAESISFIAERASSLNNSKVIDSLKQFIDDKFNDPCCKAIALSGFGDNLLQSEIEKIINDVLQYPDTDNFDTDIEKSTFFEWGINYIMRFLDEQAFQDLLDFIKRRKINFSGWILANKVVSLERINFSEKLLEFFLDSFNTQDVTCLLDLIEHLSPESRNRAFEAIFLTIPSIEDVRSKNLNYERALSLSEKFSYEKVDFGFLQINDTEELVHSIMKITTYQNKNGFDSTLIQNLIDMISSIKTNYTKAKALAYLAYYLSKLAPALYKKNLVIQKALECANELGSYHNIKTLLRLISSISDTQKQKFFHSIIDNVVKLQDSEGPILSGTVMALTRDAQIYTDITLISAELGDFEMTPALAEAISNFPERALFLRHLENPPELLIREIFKMAIDYLDRGLNMPSPKGDSLIEGSTIEIIFLLPKMPKDLIVEIVNRIEKLDYPIRMDFIKELIPYVSTKTLEIFLSYCRVDSNEFQLPEVITNMISRYVELGEINSAKSLLNEIETNSIYYIKNALELIGVDRDNKIEAKLISTFKELVDEMFLPNQKIIFLKSTSISIEVIKEYATLLRLGYNNRHYFNDTSLNPFRIATRISDYNISKDDREIIVDECLNYLTDNPDWSFGTFGSEGIGMNSLNEPDLYESKYKRANSIRILQPILYALTKDARLRVLEKYFESFIKQPRGSMLMELAALYPIFYSIDNKKPGSDLAKFVLQVCSWWQ